MKGKNTWFPLLNVSKLARVFYAGLAFTLTLGLLALLPIFDAISKDSRPALDLVEVSVVAPPEQNMIEQSKKTIQRKRPKPKLTAKKELRSITPLKPDTSLTTSLTLPITSLRPGLGDISVNFNIAAPASSKSKSSDQIVFTVRELDAPPRLLVPVRPLYPLQARQRRIEGYVDIEFEIEPNGEVNTVRVIDAEPPNVFDKAACNAAKRWRFSVPLKDGRAVKVFARQRIQFRLEK